MVKKTEITYYLNTERQLLKNKQTNQKTQKTVVRTCHKDTESASRGSN